MSYSDFVYGSAGANEGQITSWSFFSLPVHGIDSPANLYVRLAGIAQAVRDDPPWGDDPPVLRGVLSASTDVIFDLDDKLIASCANAGFARVDRDENGLGSSDDFGFAIDEIGGAEISGGRFTLTVHAAYQGDVEIRAFTFSADLLIFRPSLAGGALPRSASRFRNITREIRSTGRSFPKATL
jgi:hypothetical protein